MVEITKFSFQALTPGAILDYSGREEWQVCLDGLSSGPRIYCVNIRMRLMGNLAVFGLF